MTSTQAEAKMNAKLAEMSDSQLGAVISVADYEIMHGSNPDAAQTVFSKAVDEYERRHGEAATVEYLIKLGL